jgi:DNA-binding MarR family transcriptional regulator
VSNQLLSEQESQGQGSRAADRAVDAWVGLLRGHAGMRRTVSARLQADHELTVSEYEALLLLSQAENNHMRRVDLADSLQLTPSGVTRMLDGLRERGLVDKAECPGDARVTYAVLTDAGSEKLKAASCSHIADIRALLDERYSAEEIETLAELLGRLPGAGGCAGAGGARCGETGCTPH